MLFGISQDVSEELGKSQAFYNMLKVIIHKITFNRKKKGGREGRRERERDKFIYLYIYI